MSASTGSTTPDRDPTGGRPDPAAGPAESRRTRYRYTLGREHLQSEAARHTRAQAGTRASPARSPRTVCFVMLNPSTANRYRDDPTIRRCTGFATAWGYDRLRVVNLYGARATRPEELFALDDPVGPGNERALRRELRAAELVVAAWGVHGAKRAAELVPRLGFDEWHCLGTTKHGHPRHPLYVGRDTQPQPWSLPSATD